MKRSAQERLRAAAFDAAGVLVDLALAEEESVPSAVRLKASTEVLDRAGVPAAKRHEVTGEGGGDIVIRMYQPKKRGDEPK